MSLAERLKGQAYLGYRALIAHPLRKLFSRDTRTGIDRFLDNYATEGLVPTPLEDRDLLIRASRCIHCGLCDLVASIDAPPSLLAVALSRSSVDAPWAAAQVPESDDNLGRAETACPTGVPLRALATLVRRRAAQVSRAVAR